MPSITWKADRVNNVHGCQAGAMRETLTAPDMSVPPHVPMGPRSTAKPGIIPSSRRTSSVRYGYGMDGFHLPPRKAESDRRKEREWNRPRQPRFNDNYRPDQNLSILLERDDRYRSVDSHYKNHEGANMQVAGFDNSGDLRLQYQSKPHCCPSKGNEGMSHQREMVDDCLHASPPTKFYASIRSPPYSPPSPYTASSIAVFEESASIETIEDDGPTPILFANSNVVRLPKSNMMTAQLQFSRLSESASSPSVASSASGRICRTCGKPGNDLAPLVHCIRCRKGEHASCCTKKPCTADAAEYVCHRCEKKRKRKCLSVEVADSGSTAHSASVVDGTTPIVTSTTANVEISRVEANSGHKKLTCEYKRDVGDQSRSTQARDRESYGLAQLNNEDRKIKAQEIARRYKQITCPQYMYSDCFYAEEHCLFAHRCKENVAPRAWRSEDSNIFTCRKWKKGSACGTITQPCRFAHEDTGYYLGIDGNALVKHIECYYWKLNRHCARSAGECLYAHYDTGILAWQPHRPSLSKPGPNSLKEFTCPRWKARQSCKWGTQCIYSHFNAGRTVLLFSDETSTAKQQAPTVEIEPIIVQNKQELLEVTSMTVDDPRNRASFDRLMSKEDLVKQAETDLNGHQYQANELVHSTVTESETTVIDQTSVSRTEISRGETPEEAYRAIELETERTPRQRKSVNHGSTVDSPVEHVAVTDDAASTGQINGIPELTNSDDVNLVSVGSLPPNPRSILSRSDGGQQLSSSRRAKCELCQKLFFGKGIRCHSCSNNYYEKPRVTEASVCKTPTGTSEVLADIDQLAEFSPTNSLGVVPVSSSLGSKSTLKRSRLDDTLFIPKKRLVLGLAPQMEERLGFKKKPKQPSLSVPSLEELTEVENRKKLARRRDELQNSEQEEQQERRKNVLVHEIDLTSSPTGAFERFTEPSNVKEAIQPDLAEITSFANSGLGSKSRNINPSHAQHGIYSAEFCSASRADVGEQGAVKELEPCMPRRPSSPHSQQHKPVEFTPTSSDRLVLKARSIRSKCGCSKKHRRCLHDASGGLDPAKCKKYSDDQELMTTNKWIGWKSEREEVAAAAKNAVEGMAHTITADTISVIVIEDDDQPETQIQRSMQKIGLLEQEVTSNEPDFDPNAVSSVPALSKPQLTVVDNICEKNLPEIEIVSFQGRNTTASLCASAVLSPAGGTISSYSWLGPLDPETRKEMEARGVEFEDDTDENEVLSLFEDDPGWLQSLKRNGSESRRPANPKYRQVTPLQSYSVRRGPNRPTKKQLMHGKLLSYQCRDRREFFGDPHWEINRNLNDSMITTTISEETKPVGADVFEVGPFKEKTVQMSFREYLGFPRNPKIVWGKNKDELAFVEGAGLGGPSGRTRRTTESEKIPFVYDRAAVMSIGKH